MPLDRSIRTTQPTSVRHTSQYIRFGREDAVLMNRCSTFFVLTAAVRILERSRQDSVRQIESVEIIEVRHSGQNTESLRIAVKLGEVELLLLSQVREVVFAVSIGEIIADDLFAELSKRRIAYIMHKSRRTKNRR